MKVRVKVRVRRTAPLAFLLVLSGLACGPVVKTDCQLLGRAIRPGARIHCMADFACLRWQNDGLLLSTMDSWRLGDEYLEKICERLREKGYRAENGGVVDVNWLFRDGGRVPVARKSGFWFGKKYNLGRKKQTTWADSGKKKKDEPKFDLVYDQGKPCVEYEPDVWGKEESVPVAPEKVANDRQPLTAFVRQTARAAAPAILAPDLVKNQEDADVWTAQVLATRVADAGLLRQHCPAPGLLLVLWGCAVAANEKQDPLAAFGGRVSGTPAPQKATLSGNPGRLADPAVLATDVHPYVPRGTTRHPRHLVELRGALLDPATGQILWFTAHRADQKVHDDGSGSHSSDTCLFLPGPQATFARGLLAGFPRVRHLGGDKSYSKSLSHFRPRSAPQ